MLVALAVLASLPSSLLVIVVVVRARVPSV
jgi:hypothetical protein